MMLISLECLEDLDVVWVSQTLKDVYFVHYLLLLGLLLQEIHVDALDSYELPG